MRVRFSNSEPLNVDVSSRRLRSLAELLAPPTGKQRAGGGGGEVRGEGVGGLFIGGCQSRGVRREKPLLTLEF